METVDTVVVGAGVAGLAAARLLQGEGYRTVLLEARDRVGGRVVTDRADGRVTDLGASWIHGIEGSPVAAAAAAFSLPTREFTVGGYQPDSRPIAYYGPDGVRLTDEEVRAFVADIHTVDAALAVAVEASAADASYRDAAEVALAEQGWHPARVQRVREYLEHRAEEQYGVWIDDLAAHGLDDDAIDGDEVVFPEGYDRLPHRWAEGLDIRLSTPALRVDWGSGRVEVATHDGSFRGASAVITVPVGVLASGDLEITPPLPEPNTTALSRLEMNRFEKVFLRFPERFWDEGVYAVRQQGPEGRWWHSWYDLTSLHGEPTLLTFAAGPAAAETRGWDDDRVAESVLRQLRRLYGTVVPAPTGVHRTAWQDDPWARGSYAYMTRGSVTADHDALATPVGGRVHIAGEATWTDDPATVSAALLSGHRAAERILGRPLPIDRLWSGRAQTS